MVDKSTLPPHMKGCPIENAVHYIGKKWAINVIRDLFVGKRRFSEFLKANPSLSTKMLAARLRELEHDALIFKKVDSMIPLSAHYELTDKGRSLGNILFEMAVFSLKYCPDEVYKRTPQSIEADIELMRRTFAAPAKSVVR